MTLRFRSLTSMLTIAAAITLIAALACGAADEAAAPEAPQAAAAAATAVTGGAAPVAKAAAPKAAATAAPAMDAAPSEKVKVAIAQPTTAAVAPARDAPLSAMEAGFKYVPPPQVPGVYWDYIYTGPRPSSFSENPRFAELVKQGKLPPVEDRLPEDFKVNQGPAGIGTYGGIQRLTSTGGGPSNRMYWHKKNADEFVKVAHVGFHEISDDGRVYTFTLRKGLKFSRRRAPGHGGHTIRLGGREP